MQKHIVDKLINDGKKLNLNFLVSLFFSVVNQSDCVFLSVKKKKSVFFWLNKIFIFQKKVVPYKLYQN